MIVFDCRAPCGCVLTVPQGENPDTLFRCKCFRERPTGEKRPRYGGLVVGVGGRMEREVLGFDYGYVSVPVEWRAEELLVGKFATRSESLIPNRMA